MTLSEIVLRDRRARDEAGRKHYRPNGGEFVTNHPHGLVGEAYDECLDALNYIEQIQGPEGGPRYADTFIRLAAEELAAEIEAMKEGECRRERGGRS